MKVTVDFVTVPRTGEIVNGDAALVRDMPARFAVIATDTGPGIANLDEIMSGRYKSRTGMGRGILGVKRLADRFRINPGPPGCRVEVEVNL